jgi:hypothetical protein
VCFDFPQKDAASLPFPIRRTTSCISWIAAVLVEFMVYQVSYHLTANFHFPTQDPRSRGSRRQSVGYKDQLAIVEEIAPSDGGTGSSFQRVDEPFISILSRPVWGYGIADSC